MGMLRKVIKGITDIIYPKVCLACKSKLDDSSIGELICAQCWGKTKRNLPPFCHSCGRRLEKKNFTKHICPACARQKLNFDRAFSPFTYEGPVKELIHQFKYKNKDHLGQFLSKPMISFIKEYSLPINDMDIIVPIPLHKAKLREREFNQAQVLSAHIAKEFNKEILNDALCRHRSTKTQTELEVSERFSNVMDSFRVEKAEAVKGKNLLLVDDVLTTGATASEAAQALKNAGANIVFVLTLAN
ncbi:MAG: ComF family protein [Candidatus Omnitrophica bacterium]|nr:ComF family protein [Candidatus Omnitrophota bacterium]MBU1870196.1 ComF family protein [Candidatus Omnitrophota bacterium]